MSSLRPKNERKISIEAIENGGHCDHRKQRLEAQMKWRCIITELFDVHSEDAGDKAEREVKGC